MRRFLLVFSSAFCLFRISLVQAQTSPATPPPAQPPVQVNVPSIGAATPSGSGGSGQAQGGSGSASGTTSGKFYEYQSYCRQPLEFKDYLSDAEFQTALEPLKTTFNAKKIFSNLDAVVNFLISENRPKEARTFVIENRSLLTTAQDKALTARVLMSEKKYRDALSTLNTAVDNDKNDLSILIEYSRLYRKLDNLFEAKSALQDAMKIDRKNINKYILDLCILETEDSNHGEVDIVCPKAIKAYPKDPLPYIYFGISLRERLNYKESQKLFEKAAQIEKNEFAYTCLGEVFNLQKNYGKAIEAFKASTAVEPKSGRAQLGAALSLYQLLRYEEALPYFIKACQLDKTSASRFREAHQPLEAGKLKVSTAYYHGIQQCGGVR